MHTLTIVTETICVVTSDGRIILGSLVGHDQVQNLILNNAQERVYTASDDDDDNNAAANIEIVDLGLYVIRGDNVCMVGDYDPNGWSDDNNSIYAGALPPIQQQQT